VGIVIHAGCQLFCIDIDSCIDDNGVMSATAQQLTSEYSGAYIERSQSGRGVHIIASYVGAPPIHGTKNLAEHLELYTQKRFIALTDGTGDPLADRTVKLWGTAARYFPKGGDDSDESPDWTTEDDPLCTVTGTDDERIAILCKLKPLFGTKATFKDMWELNEAALARTFPSTTSGSYDASSVDQAFFNHLAYGFARNADSMKRIAERPDCKLRRDKWDRADYFERTILNAVAMPPRWPAKRNAPVPEMVATVILPPGVPPAPDRMPEEAPKALDNATYVGGSDMPQLFQGCTLVMDVHRVVAPDGFVMDKGQMDDDARFARKAYAMRHDSSAPTRSAWEAFTQSEVFKSPQVRGMFFDPREAPGAILEREGLTYINTYYPATIETSPGDVTPFLTHLMILFPADWRILLNYLKFMVQRKGEKAMWWPFLQGVPGNGKSFITATMAYCIGEKFTQRPAASRLDGQFNAKLYGCLFLGVDDIKVADDHGKVWEALKPMVTETRLEIEAKGIDKVTREVCFNAILNSNHKDGIRKEVNDRRIASFFAKQQRISDLARDGLTPEYFVKLWDWAKAEGWAHVAHYLATDPIDADFSHTRCPTTSSTAEHIRASRRPSQQEILAAVDAQLPGFRGGWLNSTAVARHLMMLRYRLSPSERAAMIEDLGYNFVERAKLKDGIHDLYALPGTDPASYSSTNS
jgi:hypothetical protein